MVLIFISPDCNYRGDAMSITNYLNKIKTAVYGKDVRGAIHDAIKECYDDASVNHDNANMEVKLARGTNNTLNDRLDKSEQKLDETSAQLSKVKFYPILDDEVGVIDETFPYGHVKRFGAIGNANFLNPTNLKWYVDENYSQLANDDGRALKNCFDWTTKNGKTMTLGKGHYTSDIMLTITNNIESVDADIPVYIVGDSPHESTIDNFTIPTNYKCSPVVNVANTKKIYLTNIGSRYSVIKYYDLSNTFQDIQAWRKAWAFRDVYVQNVLAFSDKDSRQNGNLYISTPAPNGRDYQDVLDKYDNSNYTRYPLEITNNSGYNAIEINNFCYDEYNDFSRPQENSAIGIVDMVNNSTGVIYIDMKGKRSFERYIRMSAPVQSEIRPGTVFEVHHNGHIAIGCSTDENDPAAKGYGAIKVRDNSPRIEFFDANNQNIMFTSGIRKASDGNEIYECKFGDVGFSMKLVGGNAEFGGFRYGGINGGLKLNCEVDDPFSSGLVLSRNGQSKGVTLDDNGRLRYTSTSTTKLNEGQILQPVSGGNTGTRPVLTNHWRDIGFAWFDTTLNKPVWWNGNNWVDSNGNVA